MKKIKAFLYSTAKQGIPLLAKLFGANLLGKQATLEKLKPYRIFSEKGEEVKIPPARIADGNQPEHFINSQTETTSFINVYQITGNKHRVKIYPYGGVKLNADVLDMDFGSSLFIKTLLKKDERPVIKCGDCIVLWSHYWGNGYYDYMYFIYAKLLRIKSVMNDDDFKQAKLAYPLVGTPFEKELMKYAGVNDEQLIDTRQHQIQADNYYLATNDNWYYHNKYDLQLLKNTLSAVIAADTGNERIYISRKGRRKLINEEEVIKLLKEFDFTIIDDVPRTVAEQIAIYRSAKVIIGPHGASYTNIINCEPGTVLIELFPNNYYPDYFRYLSTVFKLRYFALFADDIQESHYRNLDEDLYIDPERIKNTLDKILN